MRSSRWLALVMTFGLLCACSARGPLAFRPISDDDRNNRGELLNPHATAIADVPVPAGGTLVLQRLPCSKTFGTCAFDVARVSKDTARRLDTIVGTSIAVDGADPGGMPKLRVDGDPCVYVAAPTSDRPSGGYANLSLDSGDASRAIRPRWRAAPAATAARVALHERGARAPYRSARLSIVPHDAPATLVAGRYDDDPFVLLAGNGGPSDRVLLTQSGRITAAPSMTNGAHDLVVEHLAAAFVYRFDGSRYVPAPCQGADALATDRTSPPA